MNKIASPAYYKTFDKGDVIFKQGERGDCAYIIEKGSVEIILHMPDGSQQPISTRGAGAIIGEMALVDRENRTATVIAREDCTLLEISEEEFARRLDTTDPIIQMAMKVILLRYRDMLTRVGVLSESGLLPSVEDLERESTSHSDAVSSIKLVNELKEALAEDQLELYYQPINDIKDGHVLGFEALMRWNHPQRGLVPPNEFIPVAEESGLIIEMSKWALQRACTDLAHIEQELGMTGLLYMSVNFSGKDLAAENFSYHVYETLSQTDTDAAKIQIEITERMLMENPEKAQETLALCRNAGMRIAIDDFGTGYSSLSYLHHFPINCLKIDRSFISKMLHSDSSLRLVQSIISLAKNLGMSVTAEGIEEQEELDKLERMACDFGQGYFFARPLPLSDIIKTLREKDMLPDPERLKLSAQDEDLIAQTPELSAD